MRRIAIIVSGAALCTLSGCEEDEPDICDDTVVTRADPSNDFTMYSTFSVVPDSEYPLEVPPDLPANTTGDLQAASAAMRRELVALGLTEVDFVDPPTADLLAFNLAASEDEAGIVYECVPGYYWYGWWGYVWDPCAWLQPIPVEYEVATVIVGLADTVDEQVVFGGVVQGVLECGDSRQRLDSGVSRIFDQYPADQTGM
jgi:hypothetical protein